MDWVTYARAERKFRQGKFEIIIPALPIWPYKFTGSWESCLLQVLSSPLFLLSAPTPSLWFIFFPMIFMLVKSEYPLPFLFLHTPDPTPWKEERQENSSTVASENWDSPNTPTSALSAAHTYADQLPSEHAYNNLQFLSLCYLENVYHPQQKMAMRQKSREKSKSGPPWLGQN